MQHERPGQSALTQGATRRMAWENSRRHCKGAVARTDARACLVRNLDSAQQPDPDAENGGQCMKDSLGEAAPRYSALDSLLNELTPSTRLYHCNFQRTASQNSYDLGQSRTFPRHDSGKNMSRDLSPDRIPTRRRSEPQRHAPNSRAAPRIWSDMMKAD
jgi:hypothetical protein